MSIIHSQSFYLIQYHYCGKYCFVKLYLSMLNKHCLLVEGNGFTNYTIQSLHDNIKHPNTYTYFIRHYYSYLSLLFKQIPLQISGNRSLFLHWDKSILPIHICIRNTDSLNYLAYDVAR